MQQPGQQMQLSGIGGGGTQSQTGMEGAQLETVTIDEVIQTDVVTAEEDTEITEVVEKMADENVGSVVIIDDDEKPRGIITDRKVALALEETPDIAERTAQEFVDGDLVTGDSEMSIYEAINELSEESIRRLPVVDEDGTLVGIVTLDDIIVLLSMELETAADIIESQSPRL